MYYRITHRSLFQDKIRGHHKILEVVEASGANSFNIGRDKGGVMRISTS
jgi:hypothetical protein